ncbi:MAG: multicopper oxidase domain-containing protein [Anaerolineae bacterium]|nr:multicopper oxidase domain-containing protein [Anaerolineae bacterium]
MNNKPLSPRKFSRRQFLRWGAQGLAITALTGGAFSTLSRLNPAQAAPLPPGMYPAASLPPARPPAQASSFIRLAATDGYISLPGRRIFPTPGNVSSNPDPEVRRTAVFTLPDEHNGLYCFGFVEAAVSDTIAEVINRHKGNVRWPSPIIGVEAETDVYITVTNPGLVGRPDLDDAHTLHWHGFRNPNAIFDGVPEVSISVPPTRDFPYFFRPAAAGVGTYMYHCHFEDSEHVQMGMDGIIYIYPTGAPNQAYADGSTTFDRHYTLLLNEVDTTPHDGLINVQEFVWSNYDPNYWVINGRSFPDTILSDSEIVGTELEFRQPVSSLIQAVGGENILLRMINLGYQQQAMQMLGIRMRVIGHDATFLGNLAYDTHTIYIGPGEGRDIMFEAPGYNSKLPGGVDDAGPYNVYWFKNHHPQYLVNGAGDNDNLASDEPINDIFGNAAPLGGQITQVRVYASLPNQTRPNQTFPAV